ncbi:MAG: YciI family protein [Planctomycetota bacterium]|nr:YciI family protein [Planctomycetota bacterium]
MRLGTALLTLLLGACAAPNRAPEHEWCWVWILTGPRDAQVQGEERQAAFAGHFTNMERMAVAGEMLLAGPFGEPRAQPDHRGVFLLATENSDRAREIADSDPTAQAGVFEFAIEGFRTVDALDRITAMHTRAVAESGVENPPMGFHARSYVLLTGWPAVAAEQALDPRDAQVLFAGRLGTDTNERALYCLDAQTAEEVWAWLGALPTDEVEWRVMPWFASEEVAKLRASLR